MWLVRGRRQGRNTVVVLSDYVCYHELVRGLRCLRLSLHHLRHPHPASPKYSARFPAFSM